MKTRFSTYDLICNVTILQKLLRLRVNQVYDIDHKTYLIKLQDGERKELLLFESGARIQTTTFEWPKSNVPSGFSMKLRKHIKNKRLEKLTQIGDDRIVDLQFGINEAAYHVIVELYDKGNVMLTDYNYVILNLLRPHTEGDVTRFAVRETYPLDRGKTHNGPPTAEAIKSILTSSKPEDTLKKIFNPHLVYGSAILDHVLLKVGFVLNIKLKNVNIEEDLPKLIDAFQMAEDIIQEAFVTASKGYIIQKKEKRVGDESGEFYSYQEFHPMLFQQHAKEPHLVFDSFDRAVDEFYSKIENQKIDLKAMQQELSAMKKLENVRKDHEKRLCQLEKLQEEDQVKGELIARNQKLVDAVIVSLRQLLANKLSWDDIKTLIQKASDDGDHVAKIIKKLKLDINTVTLLLTDPYENSNSSESDNDDEIKIKPCLVDINLDHTAFSNAKWYYDQKRQAANKQKKTLESQGKALKSAERKTKEALKDVKTSVAISKARKVYWFEKFYWFISSENYLVIAGRDQQQNELIVKRYLLHTDLYLHAGISGASTVVIKNPTGEPVPPKTLHEAGTLALCYSGAWNAKVVTNAWWVHANQVSKTAPSGQFLNPGSFMIRGKKNYLPHCNLIMGCSFLFKLEDGSVERHKLDRIKKLLDDTEESIEELTQELNFDKDLKSDDEDGTDDSEDENSDNGNNLSTIEEENSEKNVYPDTEIFIKHERSGVEIQINDNAVGNKGLNKFNSDKTGEIRRDDEADESLFYLGDDKPVIIKSVDRKKNTQERIIKNKAAVISNNEINENRSNESYGNDEKPSNKQNSQLKRGQKAKLKKIKEKYKDQDEEERALRMSILQSAGSPKKKDKKNKKNKNNSASNEKCAPRIQNKSAKVGISANLTNAIKESVNQQTSKAAVTNIIAANNVPEDGENNAEDDAPSEPLVTADVDMLDSLTGQTLPEDELLFAIPVIAPYNAIMNYKYKVKLTPGTGKRGKTAKLAAAFFLKDKSASQTEKDLIKFVKLQDIARNMPRNVKLSAPLLMKRAV